MKKTIITLTILFGMSMGLSAQGGLFGKGETSGSFRDEGSSLIGREGPGFPGHGGDGDSPAPLGSGIAVLVGLGAAYALTKKRNN